MSKLANSRIGYCPDCGSEVRLRKAAHLGQMVTCPVCKSKLEVSNRNPIEFDGIEEEQKTKKY